METRLYNKVADIVVDIGSQNNCLKREEDAGDNDYIYAYRTEIEGLPKSIAIDVKKVMKYKLELRDILAEMPYVNLNSRKKSINIK